MRFTHEQEFQLLEVWHQRVYMLLEFIIFCDQWDCKCWFGGCSLHSKDGTRFLTSLSPQVMTRGHKKLSLVGKPRLLLFILRPPSFLCHLHMHTIHLPLYSLVYLFDFSQLLDPSPRLTAFSSLAAFFSSSLQHVQKPHGGSASNLNMLGFPFVFLVQRPHNAASIAQDPLSADLIR